MESNLTSSSSQDSIANSQTSKGKTDLAWEHVSEKKNVNTRKTLVCLYCKKIAKGESIQEWSNTLLEWKRIVVHIHNSVPPDVKFWMENSLQEFMNSKKETQEVY